MASNVLTKQREDTGIQIGRRTEEPGYLRRGTEGDGAEAKGQADIQAGVGKRELAWAKATA